MGQYVFLKQKNQQKRWSNCELPSFNLRNLKDFSKVLHHYHALELADL